MKNQLSQRHALRYAVLIAIMIGLASCASAYGVKKCNGSRGHRVPMGVM